MRNRKKNYTLTWPRTKNKQKNYCYVMANMQIGLYGHFFFGNYFCRFCFVFGSCSSLDNIVYKSNKVKFPTIVAVFLLFIPRMELKAMPKYMCIERRFYSKMKFESFYLFFNTFHRSSLIIICISSRNCATIYLNVVKMDQRCWKCESPTIFT